MRKVLVQLNLRVPGPIKKKLRHLAKKKMVETGTRQTMTSVLSWLIEEAV